MKDESLGVTFHRDTALALGLQRILAALERRLELEQQVGLYLAGGLAVHLYTGQRVTTDIDAEFTARVAIPRDLTVDVAQEDGTDQILYFDTNYNSMFSLMHESYQEDAIELDLELEFIRVFVLSPLDLAVSKLARYADIDREDIEALVRSGLVVADQLERRGFEALSRFIGGQGMVRLNLKEAVAQARAIERTRATGESPPS